MTKCPYSSTLVDKYRVEQHTANLARSALWGKVTKGYNKVIILAMT